MKLSGQRAARFCADPPATVTAALLFGEDAVQVAGARDELLAARLGPGADEEMRVDALTATTVRADPAALDAALRATGFFPGPRGVVVRDATDSLVDAIAAALPATGPDAFLLVTADVLPGRSALRKLFEGAPAAVAAAFYPDPLDRNALRALLAREGLRTATDDALDALESLAQGLDTGALRRLAQVLALHDTDRSGPLDAATVSSCAPQALEDGASGGEAAVEAAIAGRSAEARAELARLAARGASPVSVALSAGRRLRQLHAIAIGGAPAAAMLARLRAPGAADQARALATRWGVARLEQALILTLETDARLRGGASAPERALIERTLLRIATLAG